MLQLGHFIIFSALLVRPGGLNCSVGIQGGLWKILKRKKLQNVFFLIVNEKTGYGFLGGGYFLLLLTLLTNFRALFSLKLINGDYLIHRISFSFILFLPKYKQIIFI